MPKKITILLLCSAAIFVTALFTVTQLMAGENEKPTEKLIRDFQARTKSNEIVVAGLRKKYSRGDDGCVKFVEFYNDPEKCPKDSACQDSLKQEWEKCIKDEECKPKLGGKAWPPELEPGWVDAIKIEDKNWPIIWGEYLVGAGSTKGESGSDVCVEWRFTVAGSPGWDCDYMGGHLYCSCIGTYYGPPHYPDPPINHCCDPNGCVPHP